MEENKKKKKPRGKPFEKGNAPKGGRPKGSKNKVTTSIRKIIQGQIEPILHNLSKIINEIDDPKEKSDALQSWTGYIAPKFSSIQYTADEKRDISTEQYILELSKNYKPKEIKVDITKMQIVNNE